MIDKILRVKLPYNVASVSVYIAITVLDEERYFKRLIKKIKKRKDNFENFLRIKGFNVIHTHTNSIIIEFSNIKEADEFYRFLKINKIFVNQGNGLINYGLDNSFIKFACGTEIQMKEVEKIIVNI